MMKMYEVTGRGKRKELMSIKEMLIQIADRAEKGMTTKFDADYIRSMSEFVETAERLCAIQTVLEVEADDTWINEMEKGERK